MLFRSFTASAAEENIESISAMSGDFEYEVLNDGTTSITRYNGSATELKIPSVIDGYTVTEIGEHTFFGCTSLKNIIIPNTVKSIGYSAFWSCTSLVSITIPDSVTSIGGFAFWGCTNLVSITIPDGVTEIESNTFYYCTSLEKIIIPNTVKSIGNSAFIGCLSLESITIPNSVESIYSDAFSNCRSLVSITIPYNVTHIGEHALGYDYNENEGDSYYTKIDDFIIYGYSGRSAEIYANENNFQFISLGYKYEYEVLDDDTVKITDCFGNDINAQIPSTLDGYTVTEIGDAAFYHCENIKSITIPDSVASIGESAFWGCTSLVSITIPDGVTEIREYTFYDCTSLENIIIPNTVKSIGYSAFDGCTSLVSITIPDGVTEIREWAFNDCTKLENIIIPDSVIRIGYDVFEDTLWYSNQPDGVVYAGRVTYSYKGEMPKNTSITLKEGTKGIAITAFKGSENLTGIIIPDGVTEIGWSAFEDCKSLASLKIPDSVTEIGYSAFKDCTGLISITIPDSVTEIGDYAFMGCTGLRSVTIPEGVMKIDNSAFRSCKNLISITIPDSTTEIGYGAFIGCTGLKSVTIPKSVGCIEQCAFGYDEDGMVAIRIESFKIYGYTGTAAENYAKQYKFEFIPLSAYNNEHTDSDTNITVVVSAGTDAELKVTKITNPDEIEQINFMLENEKVESLFDISFVKDGTTVQPDGTVTVKIPSTNENSKVYRVETDGSLTDMNAVYDNGYMVFSTNHFSFYALVFSNENVIGDANGDGEVDIQDVTCIQMYVAKLGADTVDASVCDLDGDGKVGISDASYLQMKLAKLI